MPLMPPQQLGRAAASSSVGLGAVGAVVAGIVVVLASTVATAVVAPSAAVPAPDEIFVVRFPRGGLTGRRPRDGVNGAGSRCNC